MSDLDRARVVMRMIADLTIAADSVPLEDVRALLTYVERGDQIGPVLTTRLWPLLGRGEERTQRAAVLVRSFLAWREAIDGADIEQVREEAAS